MMRMQENFLISIDGLKTHKLRSSLTMLGIIFGVAAVIAMLSIGEGAKREALEKFKVLGVNNIIVREKDLTDTELEEVRAKFSRGLSLTDAEAIIKIIPTLEEVAPQSEIDTEAKFEDNSAKITLVGITPAFKSILNYETKLGTFLNDEHHSKELRVCILGSEATRTLFPVEDPIGKKIKIDDQWFEVIGTLGSKALFTETVGELAARNLNNDIYIPLSAMLRRFQKENQFASQINQLTIKIKSRGPC
jgi:putative ABC transport system permease protein